VKTRVLLSSGEYGIIVGVKTEQLDEPIAVFNFEVDEYHTYYVGKHSVCTHNAVCDYKNYTPEQIAKKYDI